MAAPPDTLLKSGMPTLYETARKTNSKQQFLERVGGGANPYTAVPAELLKNKPNYYFRSDTRPSAEMFRDGFSPREPGGIVYRLLRQDVAPESAVCVTSRFDVAALFPIKTPQENPPAATHIYVVYVRSVFNTRRVQARFAARSIRDQGQEQVEKAKENLFADERATPSIDARDVVACITIQRSWAGADYLAGGSYNITGWDINGNADPIHAHVLPNALNQHTVRAAVGGSGLLATTAGFNADADAMVLKYQARFHVSYHGRNRDNDSGEDFGLGGLGL